MEPIHKKVFELQIWDYFENDINSCFTAARNAQDNGGKGGQNFTAATIIFTVLDFCAGFYHGKTEPKLSLNAREVAEFITKYLGARDEMFRNPALTLKFYEVFRHGLIHQWSPKFAGVAMEFNSDEILYEQRGVVCLNVPPFFKLVSLALQDFERDLDGSKEAREKFERRLSAISTQDAQEVVALKELLPSLTRLD